MNAFDHEVSERGTEFARRVTIQSIQLRHVRLSEIEFVALPSFAKSVLTCKESKSPMAKAD